MIVRPSACAQQTLHIEYTGFKNSPPLASQKTRWNLRNLHNVFFRGETDHKKIYVENNSIAPILMLYSWPENSSFVYTYRQN